MIADASSSRPGTGSRASCAAAGSSPAGTARSTASARCARSRPSSMRGSTPSTAPTSTPASKRSTATSTRAAASGACRRCRCTPSACRTTTTWRASTRPTSSRIVERSLDRLQVKRARPRAVPLVGLPRAGLHRRRAGADAACAVKGGSRIWAAPTSTATHTAAMLDAGVPLVSMQVQYSLLDRRPEARLVPLGLQRGVQLLCYGTLAGGFFAERWLGAPEPGPDLDQPLVDQVQADHRRLRRLGGVPVAAADPEGDRCAAPHVDRGGGDALGARPARCRGGDRRRALRRSSRRHARRVFACTSTTKTTRCSRRGWPHTPGRKATPTRSNATRPDATAGS